MRLRRATSSDIPELDELWHQYIGALVRYRPTLEQDREATTNRFRRNWASRLGNERFESYVATINDSIVAFADVRLDASALVPQLKGVVREVAEFFVSPVHQDTGLAYDFARALFDDRAGDYWLVFVLKDNAPAHHFFNALMSEVDWSVRQVPHRERDMEGIYYVVDCRRLAPS